MEFQLTHVTLAGTARLNPALATHRHTHTHTLTGSLSGGVPLRPRRDDDVGSNSVDEREQQPQLEGEEADDVEREDDGLSEQMDVTSMNGL